MSRASNRMRMGRRNLRRRWRNGSEKCWLTFVWSERCWRCYSGICEPGMIPIRPISILGGALK